MSKKIHLNLDYIFLIIILSTLISCRNNKKLPEFGDKTIKVKISYKIPIDNCLNWYTDFNEIKKTVLFRQVLISVGHFGGFCCLNERDFSYNSKLSNKLNTDLFTNVAVLDDTLYAELFNKVYFLNKDTLWKEYPNPKPIKYFDINYADKNYIFFSSCSGEFGGILFVYKKKNKVTKAIVTTCPSSVTRINDTYYVNSYLGHMMGSCSLFEINDIDRLTTVSDTLHTKDYGWSHFYKSINDTTKNAKEYLNLIFRSYGDTVFRASFNFKNQLLSIVDLGRISVIGNLQGNKITILKELPPMDVASVTQFKKTAIINEKFMEGYGLIRDNTFYKVSFERSDSLDLAPTNDYKYYSFNLKDKYSWEPLPNKPEREIEFNYGDRIKFIGNYGNNLDGNYMIISDIKYKLKIISEWNFIESICTRNGNVFLNFMNLGNIDHKYNMIEITDIERFVQKYKE